MDQFITVEEARAQIVAALQPVGAERLMLRDALGRRLCESIAAPWDSPAFDNSAMDGYAFRWEDRSESLRLVGESAAGAPFAGAVGAREAVRIMTGAKLPDGADTVAMQEHCEASKDEVRITQESPKGAGANIRRQGEYMAAGTDVLRIGDELGAAEIGLLSSFGRTVVYAHRTPRVGIVTTGSELVEPDREPGDSQIVNSNAYMLEGLVRQAGGDPTVLPIVPDTEEATREALRDVGRAADLVVTVGGASVGDYDFIRGVLEELTGGMEFWKVRMKPGKPLAFGVLSEGRVPVIGLPGNPASSFVGFHQFVRPALAVLRGASPKSAMLPRLRIATTTELRSSPRRRQYIAGRLETTDGVARFRAHPDQSSGNVLVTCGTQALALVDEGVSLIEAGSLVDVELL